MKFKLFLLFYSLLSASFSFSQNTAEIDSSTTAITDTTYQDTLITSIIDSSRSISIIGVGDMMLGTNFPSTNYLPPKNLKLLDPVAEYLKNADVTFGNLEGTVLNSGGNVKSCSDPKKCYAFRMPESTICDLEDAGFDFLSIANNHSGDFGNAGRKNTMKLLTDNDFTFAGLLSCPWDTITIEGITYGFCAFSPNTGTTRINNMKRAVEIVMHLDSISDIVIVSFHGGAEGANYTHVTKKTEHFYGENRGNVYLFSHTLIDNGADVIFGHGPHVTRAMEVYKNRFIAYSLGNFCTYARFNLRGVNGVAPIVKINVNEHGEFKSGQITPIIQTGEGGPRIDLNKKVITYIQELNKLDLPESKLIVEDDGLFYLPPAQQQ